MTTLVLEDFTRDEAITLPRFTPDNHPHRGLRPDRSTIHRMLGAAEAISLIAAKPQRETTEQERK